MKTIWLFTAYENEEKFSKKEEFLRMRFSDHTEMKIFSAKFGAGIKAVNPQMVSDYRKVAETDRKYNPIEVGMIVFADLNGQEYVGEVVGIDDHICVKDPDGNIWGHEYWEVSKCWICE